MAVEVKRKNNENTYSLLRRFQDKVKKGRVLTLSKKNSFYQKEKTKRQRKKDALRRSDVRKKRDYLIKIGKLVNEPMIPGKGKPMSKR
jgi:ribosomal protein S21